MLFSVTIERELIDTHVTNDLETGGNRGRAWKRGDAGEAETCRDPELLKDT